MPCPPHQLIAREIESHDVLAVRQSPSLSAIGAVFRNASEGCRVAVRLFGNAKMDRAYAKWDGAHGCE